MARNYPFRTAFFSAGPVLFGLFQFLTSFVNDGSVLFAAAFLAVMTAFAAMVTRYHLVTFRVTKLSEHLEGAE